MRIYKLLFLIIFTIFNGCLKEKYDTYKIQNQSDHDISILAYDRYFYNNKGEIEQYNTINIKDSFYIESYNKYSVNKRIGEVSDDPGIFSEHYVDSVVIIFDNNKRIIFTCKKLYGSSCYDKPNILNRDTYHDKICEKYGGCDYTYTFTNEDYENAEVIE